MDLGVVSSPLFGTLASVRHQDDQGADGAEQPNTETFASLGLEPRIHGGIATVLQPQVSTISYGGIKCTWT